MSNIVESPIIESSIIESSIILTPPNVIGNININDTTPDNITINVNNTDIQLYTNDTIPNVDIIVNTDIVNLQVNNELSTPDIEIIAGIQGPQGVGIQGPKGDQGPALTFESLTESQKMELRGDVGDTSINYTNIFLNTLLT